MGKNNKLIEILEKYEPDVKEYLNHPGNPDMVKQIEEYAGMKLPEEFVELYMQYNGENTDSYLGAVLGLTLMNAEDILEEMKILREDDFSDMKSIGGDAISEEHMSERMVIPFAFDNSRCYFAIDMTPGPDGKKGQIITLDFDYNNCYLVADSMSEFYEFVEKMLKEGKCSVVTEEEKHFEFESGHIFNKLDDLFLSLNQNNMVLLPKVYWQKKYGKESVEEAVLQKEIKARALGRNDDQDTEELPTISLEPVRYMNNLKELYIYDYKIEDFDVIATAKNLQKIGIGNCEFDIDKLEILATLPKLKRVYLRDMKQVKSIKFLERSSSIKSLDLCRMTSLAIKELPNSTKIEEIEIEDMGFEDFGFLTRYKNLKQIKIKEQKINNLDFLYEMKKLVSFKADLDESYDKKAENEDGLAALPQLKMLQSFEYPVSDVSQYVGCTKLTEIGIDVKGTFQFEQLKGSKITGATFYNAYSEEEVERIVDEINKYIDLSSYGYSLRKNK